MKNNMIQHTRIGSIVLMTGLLLCMSPARAEVYKYVKNGVTTYSQQKPQSGAFERLEPNCLNTYLGCNLINSDWSRIPLNHTDYVPHINTVAVMNDMDPALIRAIVHAESAFNHKAVSRAGAQGLMQLMPKTQQIFGVTDPYDVKQNLTAGTRLMKQLLKKYGNSVKLAAAAYNAGETAVARYRGIPPYDETRKYVARVTELYHRYRTHSSYRADKDS